MTERFDVAIVGAGLVGAALAYDLGARGVRAVVLEKEAEPAAGASRSNSGVVHTGFDARPREFETEMILAQALRWRGVFDNLGIPSGLRLDPYFSAAKLSWLLENDGAVRGAAGARTQGEGVCFAPRCLMDTSTAMDERVVDEALEACSRAAARVARLLNLTRSGG